VRIWFGTLKITAATGRSCPSGRTPLRQAGCDIRAGGGSGGCDSTTPPREPNSVSSPCPSPRPSPTWSAGWSSPDRWAYLGQGLGGGLADGRGPPYAAPRPRGRCDPAAPTLLAGFELMVMSLPFQGTAAAGLPGRGTGCPVARGRVAGWACTGLERRWNGRIVGGRLAGSWAPASPGCRAGQGGDGPGPTGAGAAARAGRGAGGRHPPAGARPAPQGRSGGADARAGRGRLQRPPRRRRLGGRGAGDRGGDAAKPRVAPAPGAGRQGGDRGPPAGLRPGRR
jgi:hypothetical protein